MLTTKEQSIQKQKAVQHRRSAGSWLALSGKIIVWQLVAIFVVELSLSLAGLGEEEIFKLDPVLGFVHMHNKRVTWRSEGLATSYLNNDGLREPRVTIAKPAGTFRVALLGDSLTESLQVPVEKSFGYQVGELLTRQLSRPVEVINFGTSGYSTVQEYLQLKKQVVKYSPDLVLLCYNSRDCFENWSPPDEVLTNVRPAALKLPGRALVVDSSSVQQWMRTPRARFLKRFGLLREHSRLWGLFASAELDWSMHNETYKQIVFYLTKPGKALRKSVSDLSTWVKANAPKVFEAGRCTELKGSKIAVLEAGAAPALPGSKSTASVIKANSSSNSTPASKSASSRNSAAASKSTKASNSTKTITATQSPPKAAASAQQPGRATYQQVIVDTLGALLLEMNKTCTASGSRFAVVAMPVRSALYAKQGMATTFNDYDYNDELKMLQSVCKESGIPLMNVHESARSLSATDRDYLFYLVHLTPRGHDFVARELAPQIIPFVSKEDSR